MENHTDFFSPPPQSIYSQQGIPNYGQPQPNYGTSPVSMSYREPNYNSQEINRDTLPGQTLQVADQKPASTSFDEISSSNSDVKRQIAKATAVREANFLRKVYLILTTQILVTVGLTVVACLVDVSYQGGIYNVGTVMWDMIWPICVAAVLGIASLVTLLFIYSKVPFNFIVLAVYTLCWSVVVACVSGPIAGDGSVAAAFIITLVIFVGLTGLTFIPKVKQVIWVFVIAALILCAIGSLITYYMWFYAIIGGSSATSNVLYIVYCAIFAGIFSCYIVIDSLWTRDVDSKFNNYIYAAARLYTDFIVLLVLLLAMLGGKK